MVKWILSALVVSVVILSCKNEAKEDNGQVVDPEKVALVETLKKKVQQNPDSAGTRMRLVNALDSLGMYKEAIAEFQESLRISRNAPTIEGSLGAVYVKAGMRDKAEEILESIKTRANSFSSTPIDLSLLYDALGMRDEALAVLEQSFAQRAGDLQYMRTNPKFDNLRPDPRFQDLLRRMGLPPY